MSAGLPQVTITFHPPMTKHILIAGAMAAVCALSASAQASTSREKAEAMLKQLTLDEKISLMMDASPAIPRLGIPQFNWWSEALHGVARAGRATVFPQTIGMAASFDDDALFETFSIVSDEARAKFNGFRDAGDLQRYECLAFWTPNVNIFRDPRWGRGQETYGEDPYLTSRMGEAVVRGLQGDDPVYMKALAGAKHFAVHSGPEWNRHSFDARDIDPRDLHETYLPAFKTLVDAGVAQVMCAYNRYEGEPCCSNKKLLQQILRNEWGYKNIIVTDCWAMNDFTAKGSHETHPDGAHASADAVVSGTDLECGPVFHNLRQAYDEGLISEAAIDSAVVKLLDFRYRLGEIDHNKDVPWNSYTVEANVNTPEHAAKALEMARKSMVLLKNNGVLPLDASSGKRIMVMGPNANDSVMQWGNYNGFPEHTVTILEGVRGYVPSAGYERGCSHVATGNEMSVFDSFEEGINAYYYNSHDTSGRPVSEGHYTTPVALDGGGATVFSPGVNLNDFAGVYVGTFVLPEDGEYILEYSSSDSDVELIVDGKTVARDRRDGTGRHNRTHKLKGRKGDKHPVVLRFNHYDGDASLNIDVLATERPAENWRDADIVIFAGGISPRLEGEEMMVTVEGFRGGDRETIELPAVQRDFIRKLKEAGKQVVMVNCSGSAVALAPEDSLCDAILQAWYPGQAGGQAVADVIFGAYNPGGRLPVTFYRDDSQLPDFEDYSMEGRTYRYFRGEPLYPFGHGLSYTTFAYGPARLSAPVMPADGGSVTLTVPVTNTGSRDGDEVVMLYVKNPADPAGPVKSLRAFKRVHLKAGETADVELEITPATLASFDHASGRMSTLPGTYQLQLPSSVVEIAVAR